MSPGLGPPVVTPREEVVDVELTLPVPPPDVWRAITDPGVVSQWFGTLRAELEPGRETRLEFGDGDFFDLTVLDMSPPEVLRYAWRFMGTSPLDTITWTLHREGTWSRLHVADHEAGRPLAESIELGEGWIDFLSRLRAFLATGITTRYGWREEVDVSIELPHDPETMFDQLLSAATIGRWVPLEGLQIDEGARFLLEDAGPPVSLEIHSVTSRPPEAMAFTIEGPDQSGPIDTRVTLSGRDRGRTSVLGVHQSGFRSLRLPDDRCRELRARLAGRWVEAVRKACAIARAPAEDAGSARVG